MVFLGVHSPGLNFVRAFRRKIGENRLTIGLKSAKNWLNWARQGGFHFTVKAQRIYTYEVVPHSHVGSRHVHVSCLRFGWVVWGMSRRRCDRSPSDSCSRYGRGRRRSSRQSCHSSSGAGGHADTSHILGESSRGNTIRGNRTESL